MKWVFGNTTVYLIVYPKDSKLPFGSRLAPKKVHCLTQIVGRMMAKRFPYVSLVIYLDDFLIIAPTRSACQKEQTMLIKLLSKLGLQISWPKIIDPTQHITFLGIELDSMNNGSSNP